MLSCRICEDGPRTTESNNNDGQNNVAPGHRTAGWRSGLIGPPVRVDIPRLQEFSGGGIPLQGTSFWSFLSIGISPGAEILASHMDLCCTSESRPLTCFLEQGQSSRKQISLSARW